MSDYHKAVEKWKAGLGGEAWIAVDLDGTFAEYKEWRGPLHIGKPIPEMVRRVKEWLKAGVGVKVFTARYSEPDTDLRVAIVEAIQDWTEACVGERLEVTNQKDYNMIEQWDDRAVQVVPNTGLRADGEE